MIIDDVFSTDSKSEIVEFDCNNKSVIHAMNYELECETKNSFGVKEVITTTISVKKPVNNLEEYATECLLRQYVTSDEFEKDYPYLLKLPYFNQSTLENIKKVHIKMMDSYFENKDYLSAKKHATIVLKYFSINDPQALSTMGNLMRDQDRTNKEEIKCAMSIHNASFIQDTIWGKLSLAEDHHVLEEFKEAVDLSSIIIDRYNTENQNISETTYMNALIIKANALFRIAVDEQATDMEEVREHYQKAHNIKPSYDSWFGLGNIDRYAGNFDDALIKYKEAKKIATVTTEIDHEIEVLLSYQ